MSGFIRRIQVTPQRSWALDTLLVLAVLAVGAASIYLVAVLSGLDDLALYLYGYFTA